MHFFKIVITLFTLLFACANFAAEKTLFLSVPEPKNAEQQKSIELIKTYYDALDKKDMGRFFSAIADDVVHDINQSKTEQGITKFKAYMAKADKSFNDDLSDIIIMVSDDGKYAAAQWVDHGIYYKDYPGLFVPAHNQSYTLHGGHFFKIKDDKISQVTTYYNNMDFMNQIRH